MDFLVFIIVLTILMFLLEKVTNLLLGIEKKKVSETSGKEVQRWGSNIILILFLCSVPYLKGDIGYIKWYLVLSFIIMIGFQSISEWIYLKHSKQYVTTLILLIFSVTTIFNIEYFVSL